MARGRPKRPLIISDDQRATLEGWSRRQTSANGLAQRARMVLLSAEGLTNEEVARRVGVTGQTVGKWRERFIERGVEGLLDEPRPGAPRTVSDEQAERVIVATLEEAPHNATHWSTRSMAAEPGFRPRRSGASGAPSGCSRTGRRPSSSRAIRSSSRRCATWWGCT